MITDDTARSIKELIPNTKFILIYWNNEVDGLEFLSTINNQDKIIYALSTIVELFKTNGIIDLKKYNNN